MVDGNNPFAEFGGVATKVVGEDPFAEFGGKKKVPTEPVSSVGGEDLSSGSEIIPPTSGSGDSQLTQIRPSSTEEITRINDFLKTTPKAKPIDVENVNVVEKVTADNNVVTEKATVTGVEISPVDDYMEAAIRAYEDESVPVFMNAIKRGSNQADLASNLTAFGDDPDKASFEEIAKIQARNRELRMSEGYTKFSNSTTFSDAMGAFIESPATIVTELTLESMTALLKHGLVRMGVGAGSGAALGSVIPGAGTIAGAGYGAVAGLGSASLNLEYSGKMMELFEEIGVDTTDPKQLEEVFTDEQKVAEARSHALKKGIPVAIFDMVSGGIAGKIVSKPAKTLLAKAGGWALETTAQGVLGGGGDFVGQVVAGEEINPVSILAEVIGEAGGGVGEVAVGSAVRQAKRKNDLVKAVGALPPDVDKGTITKEQVALSLVTGEITTEEAAELTEAGAIAVEVDKTIPVQVEGIQRAESLPILIEKKQLEGDVAMLEAQKEATDPSFHSVIDEQIKVVQEQISEKDSQIKGIISPEPTPKTDVVDQPIDPVANEITDEKENIALAIEGARQSEDKTFEGATLDQLIEDQQLIESDPVKYYQNRITHFLKESKRDDITEEGKQRAIEEVRDLTKTLEELTPAPKIDQELLNQASMDLFDKPYSELTESEKNDVDTEALARVDYVDPEALPPTAEGTQETITAKPKSLKELDVKEGEFISDNKGKIYRVKKVLPKDKYIPNVQFYELEDENGKIKKAGAEVSYEKSNNGFGETKNSNAFAPILDRLESDENYTDSDFVNDLEIENETIGNEEISDAIQEVRDAQEDDRKLSGRGDVETPIEKLKSIAIKVSKSTNNSQSKTKSNEQEINQEGQRRKELLSSNESAKTEPVSEVEVQKPSATDAKIEAANKRIDSAAKALKDILKVDVVPNVKKSGADTGAIIDMIAQATKQLVARGIKTQAALEQVMNTLRDAGVVTGKEITKMRNFATSQLDSDLKKLWVSKDGKTSISTNENGDLVARNDKGKLLPPKEERKVVKEYTETKNLTKGKLADLEGVSERDAERKIAEESENPMQIAQAMANSTAALTEDDLDFKQKMIADFLPPITTESFVDEKDAADLLDEKGKFQEGTSIAFNYLRKDGYTLDHAVEKINSDAQLEKDTITANDIIDFILAHPKGRYQFYSKKNPNYTKLAEKFKELTGFYPTKEILERAKAFDPYVEKEEDFAGNEPAPKEEAGEISEPEKKKRAFSKKYLASEDISGETKAMAKDNAIHYLVQKNIMSVAEANSIIEEVGIDTAEAIAKDFNNDINGGVRSVLLQRIIKMHEENGNVERADELFEFATEKFTDAGQFIQAAYLWGRLTPAGALRQAKREVDKQRKVRERQDKTAIERTKKAVKKTVKESINEALVSAGVETAVEQAAEVIEEKSYGAKNKVVTKDRYKAALAKFKKSGGKAFSGGFAEEIIEIAAYHAEASGREFAKFAKRVVKDLGVAIKPKLRELYDKAKEKAIKEGASKDDFASAEEVSAYYADKQIDKIEGTVRKGLRELNKKIADIAKAHYTEYDATKSQLADKLVTEADLEPADAKRLADAIKKEFDRIFEKKKKDLLNAIVKEKPTLEKKIKHIDQLSESLLKLVNLGGFSDAEFVAAWAKANGYPELTEENIKEIKRLADIVESFKDEGFEKFRAIEDLLAYQAKVKNISWQDIAQAIWYANVLSGYQTQFVNAVSTAVNSFFEYMVQVGKNPKSASFLAKGWWDGFVNGLLNEAPEVWRSGYNPIRGKIEVPATLEIVGKDKAKYHPYNILKMVRRVMVASDVVFYEGLKEMRAYQLANSMAKEAQKNDPSIDLRNKAIEILNKNDEQFQEANETAEIEYELKVAEIDASTLSPTEKKRLLKQAKRDQARRVREIINNERGQEFNEDTKRFAAKGTFNYAPEGLLGAASRGVNFLTRSSPSLRYIVPFTNIIANVANETLNYTPYGALRALSKNKGGHIIGSRETPLTDKEWTDVRADLLTKAAIGTAFMTTLMILSGKGEDDEDPAIEITGGATGDFKKNYNLKDWQAYSFRVKLPSGEYSNWIKYQYSPLVLPLAYVGNLRDLEKYRGEAMGEDLFMTHRKALSNTKTLFLDMTFLSTINSFLGDLIATQNSDYSDKAIKSLMNIGKGFVVPNLYSQSFKQMQEWKDIPIKETTLQIERPSTWVAPILKDLPYARNVYFDKIDALGDPIIPNPDKFIKDNDEIPLAWQRVAKYKMTNLSVPSIKRMKDIDPIPTEDGTFRETAYTTEEYYNFSKIRGAYIKIQLELLAPTSDWDAENIIKKGKGDAMAKEWMTKIQKKATEDAKAAIYRDREFKAYNP